MAIYCFAKCFIQFIKKHISLQTHNVYSTLKCRGNGRFHVVSTWNTRSVFVGVYNFVEESYTQTV